MWKPFILENLHFAINAFGALSLFAIFWLYFDIWYPKKTLKEGLKAAGFLLLSISFLLHATQLEVSVLQSSLLSQDLSLTVVGILRILGYVLIGIGLLVEDIGTNTNKKKAGAVWFLPIVSLAQPILAAGVGWLYLRKVAVGLEQHLKRISLGFFILAAYELLSLRSLFVGTSNIDIFEVVAPFGVLWMIEYLVALAAFIILFKWAFFYLVKRINTQLFIILTSSVLTIFLFTAISFTFLLLKNLQDETLSRLDTDAGVLTFALDAKGSEARSAALALSQNPSVASAILDGEGSTLSDMAQVALIEGKLTSVIIADDNGQVLARGEERERVGDSLSDDSLFKRAVLGGAQTSLSTRDGALAPLVSVRAAVPVDTEEGVIGVVIAGISIDNAFMDGVKRATGLEAAIFGGDTLSATTITDFSGKTRPIGIKETNKEILATLLSKGEKSSGQVTLLNREYFAVYHPLKDVDGVPIGMVLTGKPSYSVLAAAGRSIELTFLLPEP